MTASKGAPGFPVPFHPTTRSIMGKLRDMSWPTLRNFWELENLLRKALHTHNGTGTNTSIVGGTPEENPGTGVPIASSNQAIAFGDYAVASTGDYNIAIGAGTNAGPNFGAQATGPAGNAGAGAIAIGGAPNAGAVASGQAAIAIGGSRSSGTAGAVAAGQHSVAIGPSASTDAASGQSVAIGDFVSCTNGGMVAIGSQGVFASGNQAVAIGGNTSGGNSVAIGTGAFCNAARGVAIGGSGPIGDTTNAQAPNAVALGSAANAAHTNGTALGFRSATTVADQIVLGATAAQTGTNATRMYCFGTSTAPTDSTIPTSGITLWLDEAGNNLKFRVRYSDGVTLKTGTVALV